MLLLLLKVSSELFPARRWLINLDPDLLFLCLNELQRTLLDLTAVAPSLNRLPHKEKVELLN